MKTARRKTTKTARRMRRKTLGETVVGVKLTDPQIASIDEAAAARGVTRSAILRGLVIREFGEGYGNKQG